MIEEVVGRLKARRISAHQLHWRPGVILGGSGPEGGIVTDPHGKPPRGLIASILKLGLLVADWNVGYWGKIRHRQAKSKIAISDRYFEDLLVDPIRYRYGASKFLARWTFKLAPQPNLVFVLHADPEVIYARKQEVTPEELERQILVYREMGKEGGDKVNLISVNREVREIGEEILSVIEGWWTERRERLP